MKAMKLLERNVQYLDWNQTYYLNPVYVRRFIRNKWTHVIFKGKTIKPQIGSNVVTFKEGE
jgi:hypothetical protein